MRFEFGIAVMNDIIYVCGGMAASGLSSQVLKVCEQFAATPGGRGDGSWSSAPSLPSAVTDLAMATSDGKLYVIGGYDGASPLWHTGYQRRM